MPRKRARRIFPVFLSVNEAQESLGVRSLKAAIDAGELPAYESPTGSKRRRILVRDLEAWVMQKWRRV
jgi:hypothetical protein